MKQSNSADRMYVLKSGAAKMLARVKDDFELPVSGYQFTGDHQGINTLQNFAGQRENGPTGKQAKWDLKKR